MAVWVGSLQTCVGALNHPDRNEMPLNYADTPDTMCTSEMRKCLQGERKSPSLYTARVPETIYFGTNSWRLLEP